jgi:hypothetical protein
VTDVIGRIPELAEWICILILVSIVAVAAVVLGFAQYSLERNEIDGRDRVDAEQSVSRWNRLQYLQNEADPIVKA